MSLMTIAWDDPGLVFEGALELRRTPTGLAPRRLPAWTAAQMPDPVLDLIAAMPSGVRLVLRTDARRLELEVLETGLKIAGADRRDVAFDLMIDDALAARALATEGPTLVVDGSTTPPSLSIEPGRPSLVVFADLPAGEKILEIWLPQSATLELRALRLDGRLLPPAPRGARRWSHYGSSISHGMEADGPSETWPAVAARAAGVALTSLGFAGQCHLDPLVARTLRDGDADLISLKLGINVLNADSMRERAFVPAVHGFIDAIRETKPKVPILVISPILVPVAEQAPGPTLSDGRKIYVIDRPSALMTGALTAERVRQLLASIVARRRDAGDDRLYYMDGLQLFGPGDLADLPDGLHPNAAGLRRMGERFAAGAFGPGGAFA